MARSTRSEIQLNLLKGLPVEWRDANKNVTTLTLGDPKERRLFAFLLRTHVRQPTGLPHDFTEGLAAAYRGTDDPASVTVSATVSGPTIGPWRLKFIETEGFGGLNIWGGPPFRFDFDGESLLLEGPNGSGKSSFVGAILWALSGERPRDQTDGHAHEPKPVFGDDERPAGGWPPLACYPPSATELRSPPRVRVRLAFEDPRGSVAMVERTLDGGKVTVSIDPCFQVPSILLEAGLLMPARLTQIRFNEGSGRLKHAVQKLTGLDDLVAIGVLVDGLCHRGREYLSYKRRELSDAGREFVKAIAEARRILAAVDVAVPDFTPAHTDDAKGEMAMLGKRLTDRAAELTQVVSNDLAAGLPLATSKVQHQVISAIEAAKEDIRPGIEGLSSWQTLQSIAVALDTESAKRVSDAIARARDRSAEAIELLKKSSKDSKFQLKALASQWHAKHKSGPIEDCPLCERNLNGFSALALELEMLRSAGDAAARTFDDNLNAISLELESSLPAPLKKHGSEILTLEPRATIVNDLRERFVTKDRYSKILVKCPTLVEKALAISPGEEMSVAPAPTASDLTKTLDAKIAIIERLLDVADWSRTHLAPWSEWWRILVGDHASAEAAGNPGSNSASAPAELASEPLSTHLWRLSDALATAEPYRKAADLMRTAWKQGRTASPIERELKCREAIVESLAQLKKLGSLSGSIARETIEQLSSRISSILKQIHLAENLRFSDARLQHKEGLVVRGALVPELTIDATLVANTSWLRAVLWAFVFALREDAVEQVASDPLPLFVFDDPQSTFDSEHRHRWAQYIASLQNSPSKVQIVLATYDEIFLELIKVNGVTGRQAMIAAPGPELGHVGILEGDSLSRKWSETQMRKTQQAGRDYIAKVREYVEGLLRLMLRGQAAGVMAVGSGFVVGNSRDKIQHLSAKGIAPWDREEFKALVRALDKNCGPIKYMEMAHHSGAHLGMSEAEDVETHWRKKLGPALNRCFKLAREHHILHGALSALHAPPPTVSLPEGHEMKVRQIPLRIIGRAAALSDGRVADGRFDFAEFSASQRITLAQHFAYRLNAPTLEPVARPGDMLLVKEPGEPSVKSLVVALHDDRILARRFEIAENHSDVAVLTAQAINPRQIAPPVITLRSTIEMHKVIGVLYEEATCSAPPQTDMEVCECIGEAVFADLVANALGLVEVDGRSAEPHALDKQYLIVKKELVPDEALKTLDGKPIIAADSDDNYYFKRLRSAKDRIVLESLDSGGDYGPVVLSLPGSGENCLQRVWPVAGVLFELPA